MSTNELNTVARDLKELRLMAEQLDVLAILYKNCLVFVARKLKISKLAGGAGRQCIGI